MWRAHARRENRDDVNENKGDNGKEEGRKSDKRSEQADSEVSATIWSSGVMAAVGGEKM